MSQKQKVVKWLKAGQTLTPKEAYYNGMGMRLGAIIHTLRHEEEMNIINLNKSGKDRYAEYKLIKEVKKEEQSNLDLGINFRSAYDKNN